MKRWFLWAIVCAAAGFALGRGRAPAHAAQPIAFNHAVHTKGAPGLACIDCHAGAEREARAGLPAIERCLACHMKPQSVSPEEAKVRDLAVVVWRPVTRNAGHVYFSHRAHTSLAHMPCAACHGDVTTWTRPPDEPNGSLLSMDACVDCHRARGARTDCRTCHR